MRHTSLLFLSFFFFCREIKIERETRAPLARHMDDSRVYEYSRPSSFDLVDELDDEETLEAKLESTGMPFGGTSDARGERVAGPGSPRRNTHKGIGIKSGTDRANRASRASSPLVSPKADPMRFLGGAVFARGDTAVDELRMPVATLMAGALDKSIAVGQDAVNTGRVSTQDRQRLLGYVCSATQNAAPETSDHNEAAV